MHMVSIGNQMELRKSEMKTEARYRPRGAADDLLEMHDAEHAGQDRARR